MSTQRVRNTVRGLGAAATVAASVLIGMPTASAEVVGIEVWDAGLTGKVSEVHAGADYYFVAAMGGQLKTYGWVYFFDNGQIIPSPWYPGTADGVEIYAQNGRYQAISHSWTATATGTHTIKATQCANGCSYIVNEMSVPVTVQ